MEEFPSLKQHYIKLTAFSDSIIVDWQIIQKHEYNIFKFLKGCRSGKSMAMDCNRLMDTSVV